MALAPKSPATLFRICAAALSPVGHPLVTRWSAVDRQRIDQAAHGDGRPADQRAARAAGRCRPVEQAPALDDQVVGRRTFVDRPDLLDRPEMEEVGAGPCRPACRSRAPAPASRVPASARARYRTPSPRRSRFPPPAARRHRSGWSARSIRWAGRPPTCRSARADARACRRAGPRRSAIRPAGLISPSRTPSRTPRSSSPGAALPHRPQLPASSSCCAEASRPARQAPRARQASRSRRGDIGLSLQEDFHSDEQHTTG
jgi:hypothetical protein